MNVQGRVVISILEKKKIALVVVDFSPIVIFECSINIEWEDIRILIKKEYEDN